MLLLLDEPMSNLDYRVRLELRHELRALQQRVGITAIYVTHDREEALTLADRIAVIDAGRIAQLGTPDEVFHRPVSPFVAGFMGADNAIDVMRAGDAWSWPPTAAHGGARARVHFRADRATIAAPHAHADRGTLAIDGTIAQRVYLGTQYRYRIHAGSDDFWVDDPERRDEGAPVRVLVPPDALLVFPAAA
ncbi:MAG TPA: ABC transporter ATP-binding protein [Casimicrobiaceae bacterium]|nr:ABC transporter ATP-binding protein [Casimicrobiaceae bacterium]